MKGLAICRSGPKLSHLFFANDNLIFCKAAIEECDTLQRILEVYENTSGQQLNWAKTSLFCSKNTSKEIQEEIKGRFGAQVIKQHVKYLGLPSLVGVIKGIPSMILRRSLVKSWQGGKIKCCPKPERKF